MNAIKKTKPKRLLSMLLVLMMVLPMLPTTAFAEDLGTITGLTLNQSTGTITWDAYSGATSYSVWVTSESGTGTPLNINVTGTSFDLKQGLREGNIANGTYYPYVVAYQYSTMLASTGKKKTAGYVWANTAVELAVPGNIQWDGTNASWNAVANASKYEYKIVPADGSSGYVFSDSTTDGTTTSVTATATFYIAGKAYVLQVRAVGDGTNYKTGSFGSSAEVTPNTGSPTVTGLTLNQSTGTITWDAYSGATKYAVWVTSESGTGTPLNLNVTGTSFDLKQGLRDGDLADGTYYPYVLAYNSSTKIASTGQKTTAGYVWAKGASTPLIFADDPAYDIPAGTQGETYTATTALTATGGTAPYEFSIDPAVPGLSINSENKLVYTRPTVQGATTANIIVMDDDATTSNITINIGAVSAAAATTYTVTINKPSNVTKTALSGAETQTVNAGDAITEIVYTANDGYYFYSSYGIYNKGIRIEKISNTQIKIWGTPTGDVTVPVGGPAEKATQAAPTGVAGGELKITGTTAEMEYAIAGSDSWTDCTATETAVTSAGGYKVRLKETDTKKAGAEITVTVTAPHTHTWEEVAAVASTCIVQGNNHYWHCTACDKYFKDDKTTETTVADEKLPLADHMYTATVTAPTCTDNGFTTHTCTVCNDNYNDTPTEATGHSFGKWAHVDGTNTHTRVCSACEAVETENCEFTATVTEPTCTEGGYTTHTCSVCGYSYNDTPTDATGHSFGEWAHVDGTKTHTRICSVCEAVETENCEFTASVTEPTCTEGGYTTHTCSACGYSYTDTPTEATGHSFGEWHFEGGVLVRTCACGKTETIFQYVWQSLVRAFTAVWLPVVSGFESLWRWIVNILAL